jgi:hypothetical protein
MCGNTLTILNNSGPSNIICTSANGTFSGYYYNSSGTADYCVTLTPNGGSSTSCSQSNTTTDPATAQYVYSTNYGAADLIVNSGEDFELTTIKPELWINGGGTFSSVTLSYYADNSGSPGTLIGTETVTPSSQTYLGAWSGGSSYYRYEVTLNVTPFTFTGQTNTNTTYWVGISNVTETNNNSNLYWGVDNTLGGNYYGYTSSGGSSWSSLSYDFVYEFSGNCIPIGGNTYGCTDPIATNYDPLATVDDGSCEYCSVTLLNLVNANCFDSNAVISVEALGVGPFTYYLEINNFNTWSTFASV